MCRIFDGFVAPLVVLAGILTLAPARADDQTVKLRCVGTENGNYLVSRSGNTLPIETRRINFSVKIATIGSDVWIESSGDRQEGIVTNVNAANKEVADYSSDDRWEISTTRKHQGRTSTQSFLIDRLTGRLNYRSVYATAKGTTTRTVEAYCWKAGTSEKQF